MLGVLRVLRMSSLDRRSNIYSLQSRVKERVRQSEDSSELRRPHSRTSRMMISYVHVVVTLLLAQDVAARDLGLMGFGEPHDREQMIHQMILLKRWIPQLEPTTASPLQREADDDQVQYQNRITAGSEAVLKMQWRQMGRSKRTRAYAGLRGSPRD